MPLGGRAHPFFSILSAYSVKRYNMGRDKVIRRRSDGGPIPGARQPQGSAGMSHRPVADRPTQAGSDEPGQGACGASYPPGNRLEPLSGDRAGHGASSSPCHRHERRLRAGLAAGLGSVACVEVGNRPCVEVGNGPCVEAGNGPCVEAGNGPCVEVGNGQRDRQARATEAGELMDRGFRCRGDTEDVRIRPASPCQKRLFSIASRSVLRALARRVTPDGRPTKSAGGQ
jgi:hypothetical protein